LECPREIWMCCKPIPSFKNGASLKAAPRLTAQLGSISGRSRNPQPKPSFPSRCKGLGFRASAIKSRRPSANLICTFLTTELAAANLETSGGWPENGTMNVQATMDISPLRVSLALGVGSSLTLIAGSSMCNNEEAGRTR